MVWNSAQTPLYQAVRAYNERKYEDCSERQCSKPQCPEEHSEKQCSSEQCPKPQCSEKQRPEPQCFEEKHSEPQRSEKQCSEPRESAHKRIPNPPKPSGIDRDMLLILMVIFILQSEKADEGLILALLFVMMM